MTDARSSAEEFQRLLKSAADRHRTPLFSCESLLAELRQATSRCEVELERAQHRIALAVLRRRACLQETQQIKPDVAQLEDDLVQVGLEISEVGKKIQNH